MENFTFKKTLFLFFIFFILTYSFASVTSEYLSKYRPLADNLSPKYGIPSRVILAIAIFESDYGRSKIAVKLNNHFGFTGKNNASFKTRYKQYNSVQESYLDFCIKMSKTSFYNKIKNNKNPEIWINHISKMGYSSHPKVWRKSVNRILNTIP